MSNARDKANIPVLNLTAQGISVDSGTIKLDGNYPVGADNVALGDTALDSNVSGGNNTAIGSKALTANTTYWNTAVGFEALCSTISGATNTAVGARAMCDNSTGGNNVSVG